jgi:hypothetical protein
MEPSRGVPTGPDVVEARRRQLVAALHSGDPRRVTTALDELDDLRRRGDQVELPAPPVAVLDAFGGDVPEDVLVTFLRLLRSYVAFFPAPHPDQARAAAVEALLRHGGGQSAREVSLQLAGDPDPAASATAAMAMVGERRLHDDREERAARRLVSYLLDNPSTRDATLRALREWPAGGRLEAVVRSILPQLDPGEADGLPAP